VPPIPRPGGQTPRIEFTFFWSPNEMAHYFKAIANYQALLTEKGEDLIPLEHPVVQVQLEIVERMIPLIGSGVVNGWDVGGLIEVQNLINQAMQERKDGEEG